MKQMTLPLGSKLIVLLALGGLALLLGVMAGEASHYRYGTTSWVPTGGNSVDFSLQEAWRRGSLGCIDPATGTATACTGPGGFAGVGDVVCSNSTWDAGDATFIIYAPCFGSFPLLVTSIDAANDWLFGQALDPASLPGSPTDTQVGHTYPAPGNYLSATSSCCRIGVIFPNAHINNPDDSFRVETLVNVGTGNSSPVSGMTPIKNCPLSAVCTFQIPIFDPNGDTLNCRFSTPLEAGSVAFNQPGPPEATNAAAVSSSCLYTWDTTGATMGPSGYNTLYSTQVTIEDRDSLGAVKSKVAVDFLIQLQPVVGDPPVFDQPPTPTCGSTINGTVGTPMSFTVQASDPNTGDTVTLTVAGLPPGATMTPPLPATGNPVSSVFNWTPSSSGTFVVNFTATDQNQNQAQCSLTLAIAACATSLALSPSSASNPVNTPHTVTATATCGTAAQSGVTVNFTVTGSGGSTPTPPTGSCVTDANGQCTFTYTSATAGSDTIEATAFISGQQATGQATKTWTVGQVCPPDDDDDFDDDGEDDEGSDDDDDDDGQRDDDDDDDDTDGTVDALDNDDDNDGDEDNEDGDDDNDPSDDCDLDDDDDGDNDDEDNCPTTANSTQDDDDGDGHGDECDDSDGDNFVDAVELHVGTGPAASCGPNAWPADINNDGFSDTVDILNVTGRFGNAVTPANVRYDIKRSDHIDIADIAQLTNRFSETCLSP